MRRLDAVYIVVALAAVLVAGLLLASVVRGPSAPLTYTQPEYQAERRVYAPGETLVYTASLTIARAGDIDEVERGFRTWPAAERARLCSGEFAPLIEDDPPPFPLSAVGNEVESRIEVRVPHLPPGEYVIVSSAKKGDGGEAITEVGFSILEKCDGT